ncbi:MAG TPA: chemotaxis response regulator protein-glutamate methylesterase [Candidatus Angelobacter sp.]|nr:chemotaxis response regulator protein-glutamate methylesterase [Candidatus Angelobacter sp.]
MSEKLRVLVVDDSALMRKLIPQILARDSDIEVVGTAMDGAFGLRKIEELKPQVVTLDLEMPRMDGMETLRQITRRFRIPVIVVSAHTTDGASATFKALALGAFDFVAKPRDAVSSHMDQIAEDLISKIKVAAKTQVLPREAPALGEPLGATAKPAYRPKKEPTKIIAIGISTGGPNALQYLLAQLPGDFSGSIVVVQHMPEGFTEMFARRLNESCEIDVKEAQSGDLLIAGRALICPGNRHIKVRRMPLGNIVVLSDESRVNGHRPSVDVLFRSVAAEFGGRSIGVLMTGMGDDGALGMGLIKSAGGLTIAQSEESCVVFGMPKAAIERGYAMRVIALDLLANTLNIQSSPERATREVKV